MNYSGVRTRRWTLLVGRVRVDVWFKTARGKVTEVAVTLSLIQGADVRPVIRYDTAHGVVHRHTFWGEKERIEDNPFKVSDLAICFRLAYQDIIDNFARYLERLEQGRGER